MGNATETGLAIVASSGVTLRDIAIDYDPLPFTQGRVVGVNPAMGTFDLEVERGYGDPAAEIYQSKGANPEYFLMPPAAVMISVFQISMSRQLSGSESARGVCE